ncbi:MAG: 50S ribosomal protein L30 [Nanoarchaeota archaeon]
MEQKRVAVIRLKGDVGLKRGFRDTFKMLKLYKKQNCVVIKNTPEYIGMLNVIKDCATWGEIDEETFKLLLQKRGRLARKKSLTEDYLKDKLKTTIADFARDFFSFKKELSDIPGVKLFFKLSPPRHGFEPKGLKAHFSMGGALGYRKDKINDLLRRMM